MNWNQLLDISTQGDINNYFSSVDKRNERDYCHVYTRIEPRTCEKGFANALSFEVFDPFWMLARQWQFGRFKGKDCGSTINTKIKTTRRRLDSIYLKNDKNNKQFYSTNNPMEYEVEKMNRTITPFIRIESALHFKKMIEEKLPGFKINGITEEEVKNLCSKFLNSLSKSKEFALDSFITVDEKEKNPIEKLKVEQNDNLKRLYATYGKRIFDGYKLFLPSWNEIKEIIQSDIKLMKLESRINEIIEEYKGWFRRKYIPIKKEAENCWNEEKLGYEVSMGERTNIYEAEDYHTGKLEWYSFDGVGNFSKNISPEDTNIREKSLSYIPVAAKFPGSPASRLWEFEDEWVQFGQQDNDEFSMLANAVVMQYVSMYGNDWMLTPVEAENGTILDVEGIIITDTFGERIYIGNSAEEMDKKEGRTNDSRAFIDRWSLFGTTKSNAYQQNNFSTQKGLLFPPSLPRCEESEPIEEVQFLRDEMANMLWGVENIINDGCGGTLSGKTLSDAILAVVDEQKDIVDDTLISKEEYDYSFLVQNRVPIHWIPFIPQHLPKQMRDIRFRRGKMPIYYNGEYNPVRPSTELLQIKEVQQKDPVTKKVENVVLPRYINEEEIIGYGVKVILTAQRTRWFLGKSFTWTGAKKVISMYQANSGLMFDELITNDNKAILLEAPDTSEVEE